MNGNPSHRRLFRLGLFAAMMLTAFSVKADPIPDGGGDLLEYTFFVPVTLAILLEAICIRLMLSRWRRPRFLILWVMLMHLVTYPLFLVLLWLAYGKNPVFAAVFGEGTIIMVEGAIVYLICRFIASAQSPLPVPSINKSLFVSLIGNICSAVAFPLLAGAYGRILYTLMSRGEE